MPRQNEVLAPLDPGHTCCWHSQKSRVSKKAHGGARTTLSGPGLPHGQSPLRGKSGTQLPSNRVWEVLGSSWALQTFSIRKSHKVQFPWVAGRVNTGWRDKWTNRTPNREPCNGTATIPPHPTPAFFYSRNHQGLWMAQTNVNVNDEGWSPQGLM